MMKSRNGIVSFFISDFCIYHHVFIGILMVFSQCIFWYFYTQLYDKLFGYLLFYKINIYNKCHFGFVDNYKYSPEILFLVLSNAKFLYYIVAILVQVLLFDSFNFCRLRKKKQLLHKLVEKVIFNYKQSR